MYNDWTTLFQLEDCCLLFGPRMISCFLLLYKSFFLKKEKSFFFKKKLIRATFSVQYSLSSFPTKMEGISSIFAHSLYSVLWIYLLGGGLISRMRFQSCCEPWWLITYSTAYHLNFMKDYIQISVSAMRKFCAFLYFSNVCTVFKYSFSSKQSMLCLVFPNSFWVSNLRV